MNIRQKRIFVVDDQPDNIAVIKLLLEQYGAIVWFDRWGDKIKARLEEFAPVDLILLDLMYPGGLTGYDFFRQIRAFEGMESVPIAAVSASNPTSAISLTREAGFSGFIAKPIDYDRFPSQVEALIRGEQVWVAS